MAYGFAVPVLKRRPRLSMIAPRSIETGREVELRAIVDCAAPVSVRGIGVDVVGRAVWLTSSQYGDQRQTSDFFRATAPLFAGGELAAGRLALPARVRVPTGLPGSYRGRRIHIEYVASVRVDIPWWPDAAESFDLHVAAPDTAAPARPIIIYSSPDGPGGRAPYFELSLPTTGLVPGTRLEIAASFSNVEHNRYRALEIELCALETIDGFLAGGTSERSATRWIAELDGLREGEPFRTRVVVPLDMAPAFDVDRIRLTWLLRARARVGWGRDPVVEVPVTVHRVEAAAVAVRAPPEVGSERVAALWRRVGAASGLTLVDGVLSGASGGARVSIWRELSGRRGPLVVGEIDLPDLRIGLRLDGRRKLPRARDQRQGELLAERLDTAFRDAGAVSAADLHIRCTARGSGTRRGPLAAFVTAVVDLARQLMAVRAELPAPARLTGEIDAWSASARALGARLEAAGPSLRGERDGLAFEIGVGWSEEGEPAALEMIVRAPGPIDRRHHLRWEAWDPRPDDNAIGRVCDDALSLEIDRAAARARFPRESGLELAATRLEQLCALIRELCRGPGGGAYR